LTERTVALKFQRALAKKKITRDSRSQTLRQKSDGKSTTVGGKRYDSVIIGGRWDITGKKGGVVGIFENLEKCCVGERTGCWMNALGGKGERSEEFHEEREAETRRDTAD